MPIPEHIIDEIRDRNDIVEVVSQYVPMKKAGRNFKANCPFHQEKSPSFMVSPDKQIYHCFGCGAGGNVFSFLMNHVRVDFPEAVKMLADRVGVKVPAPSKDDGVRDSLSQVVRRINQLAESFYRERLDLAKGVDSPRDYLKRRGITEETIKTFRLGYAPKASGAFLSYAKRKGFDDNTIEKAGFVIRRDDGTIYDRFRNRIIFPIKDLKDSIIAFGGRVLDNAVPKYMNSPDTPVYNKGRHLYGLNIARDYIRQADSVIIVEGYMDLLTPHQAGFRNIVASLGTALTADQIRLIKRFTRNVYILYDSDKAGQMAMIRNLDALVTEELNIRVVQLSEGYDPDSYIKERGKEDFEKALKMAIDLFDFKLGYLLKMYSDKSLEAKVKISKEMLETINRVGNAIVKADYIRRLSDALSIPEEALYTELKKAKTGKGDYLSKETPAVTERIDKMDDAPAAEKMIAGLMLEGSDWIERTKSYLSQHDFDHPHIKKMVRILYEVPINSKGIKPSQLISRLKEEVPPECISALVLTVEGMEDKEKCLEDCVKRIKQNKAKRELKSMQSEIQTAQLTGDNALTERLMGQYNRLLRGATRG